MNYVPSPFRGESNVQGRYPGSRRAGVACAVRRHDRDLVASLQQSVGAFDTPVVAFRSVCGGVTRVGYVPGSRRASPDFAPDAGHDGKTGIAAVPASLT